MNQSPTTLVCISDEDGSTVALKFGCMRALRRKHELTLLHVVEPTEFQGLASITEAMRKERTDAAGRLILQMEKNAINNGVKTPNLMIREDTLANGIVSAIEENPSINMVILAIRPDSLRGPKLMEALTEQLGTSINVPIMMVPGNLTSEQIEQLS